MRRFDFSKCVFVRPSTRHLLQRIRRVRDRPRSDRHQCQGVVVASDTVDPNAVTAAAAVNGVRQMNAAFAELGAYGRCRIDTTGASPEQVREAAAAGIVEGRFRLRLPLHNPAA